MSERPIALWGWLAIAVASLGAAPLVKKLALEAGAGASTVALSTAILAAGVVFGALLLRGQGAQLVRLSRGEWLAILLVGAMGSGLVPLFGILALTETTASNRALFQSAYPVATALAARWLLAERLSPIAYGWIVLVCTGLVLMNLDPGQGNGISLTGWPFWLLLATLPLIGLSDVIAKRSLRQATPEVVAAGRTLGGLLILLVLLPRVLPGLFDLSSMALLWMLLSGLSMGLFAIALYQVFQRAFAAIAASLIALAPLLTLLAETVFLGLRLEALQWLGFAMVLLAVVGLARRAG
ncbi:MAG: EamA family transporter [Wenzhouxiangella sp.]